MFEHFIHTFPQLTLSLFSRNMEANASSRGQRSTAQLKRSLEGSTDETTPSSGGLPPSHTFILPSVDPSPLNLPPTVQTLSQRFPNTNSTLLHSLLLLNTTTLPSPRKASEGSKKPRLNLEGGRILSHDDFRAEATQLQEARDQKKSQRKLRQGEEEPVLKALKERGCAPKSFIRVCDLLAFLEQENVPLPTKSQQTRLNLLDIVKGRLNL